MVFWCPFFLLDFFFAEFEGRKDLNWFLSTVLPMFCSVSI